MNIITLSKFVNPSNWEDKEAISNFIPTNIAENIENSKKRLEHFATTFFKGLHFYIRSSSIATEELRMSAEAYADMNIEQLTTSKETGPAFDQEIIELITKIDREYTLYKNGELILVDYRGKKELAPKLQENEKFLANYVKLAIEEFFINPAAPAFKILTLQSKEDFLDVLPGLPSHDALIKKFKLKIKGQTKEIAIEDKTNVLGMLKMMFTEELRELKEDPMHPFQEQQIALSLPLAENLDLSDLSLKKGYPFREPPFVVDPQTAADLLINHQKNGEISKVENCEVQPPITGFISAFDLEYKATEPNVKYFEELKKTLSNHIEKMTSNHKRPDNSQGLHNFIDFLQAIIDANIRNETLHGNFPKKLKPLLYATALELINVIQQQEMLELKYILLKRIDYIRKEKFDNIQTEQRYLKARQHQNEKEGMLEFWKETTQEILTEQKHGLDHEVLTILIKELEKYGFSKTTPFPSLELLGWKA